MCLQNKLATIFSKLMYSSEIKLEAAYTIRTRTESYYIYTVQQWLQPTGLKLVIKMLFLNTLFITLLSDTLS